MDQPFTITNISGSPMLTSIPEQQVVSHQQSQEHQHIADAKSVSPMKTIAHSATAATTTASSDTLRIEVKEEPGNVVVDFSGFQTPSIVYCSVDNNAQDKTASSDTLRIEVKEEPGNVVVDFSGFQTPSIVYCSVDNNAQDKSNDSPASPRSRKRPRSSEFGSPLVQETTTLPSSDFVFEMNEDLARRKQLTGTSTTSRPLNSLPVSMDSSITSTSNHQYQRDILSLLQDLNLTISNNGLPDLVQKLINIGYDSTLTLGFVSSDDLSVCGLENASDRQIVQAAAKRNMNLLSFRGPGAFSDSVVVSRWLMMCGIPKHDALNYAEMLRQFGYTSVPHLELITHDHRAVSNLKRGHVGLLMHCIYHASTSNNSPVNNQDVVGSLTLTSPPVLVRNTALSIAVSPSTAAVAEEFSRDPDFDTTYDRFLDSLLQTNPQDTTAGMTGMPTAGPQTATMSHGTTSRVDPVGYNISLGYRNMQVHAQAHMHNFNSMCERSQQPQHPQQPINDGTTNPPAGLFHSNPLPAHIVKLLQEAVNMPAPNPCRRGKKIYWSILANGGMQNPRFQELRRYTASELQNGYMSQYHNPISQKDPWTQQNIEQLEKAVQDPRCRHLKKVCWELIATGRTGCPEYASLARFSASQLRSRYRSLFGDKRPQRLRGENKVEEKVKRPPHQKKREPEREP